MTFLLITLLIRMLKNWRQQRQLRWQHVLANKGIGFRTRIMQVLEEAKLFNGYKKIHIMAMIRVNGKQVCYKMHTWMKPGEAPQAGERVMIRYQPGTHHVLVKQIAV